ncbi:Metastasis-associated protein MTA3 [Papilio xuthus]|uniref:Metastasis-associated protein MTA3 n=1 Tax=Papilio xuthus TaxID=66420 RepID=A0A194PHK0_PAPXU|nr:Metastasis-associated protein MTA3 [Papilio xuthus]
MYLMELLSLSTDCVYFETSSTSPYQIRRIEELNKTASGNVEAKVMCFYRRRDLPNPLIQLADKHQMAQSEDSPVAMKLKKICLKTPIGEEQAAQAVLDPALGHFQGEATRRVVVACCGVRTPVLLVGRSLCKLTVNWLDIDIGLLCPDFIAVLDTDPLYE